MINRRIRSVLSARWGVPLAAGLVLAAPAVLPLSAFAANPVKITFGFRGGATNEETVKAWIADFEKADPDIQVEWRTLSGDWMNQIPVWVSTGTAPDVFEMWGADMPDWANNGVLLDLRPLVKRDFTQQDLSDFFPPSWNADIVPFGPKQGMQYGLPHYGNVYTFYYNKTLFDNAGVPYLPVLDQQVDWTWDGLTDIGKKLTRSDGTKITQYGLQDNGIWHPTARGSGWIHAAGGKVVDLPAHPARVMIDQPPAIQALQYLQDLIYKYHIASPVAAVNKGADFRAGRSAMDVSLGTGYLTRLQAAAKGKFTFDIGPRPMGPGGNRGYYITSDSFGISATSKQVEAAWKFLRYISSTQGEITEAKYMGRAPVRRSAFKVYSEMFPGYSLQYQLQGMEQGEVSPETFMVDVINARNLIWKAVRDKIAVGKEPAQQAISEIAPALRALYAKQPADLQ